MYSASEALVRLSFAVPIDVAVKVKDWPLRDGRVSLGVSTQDLTQRFADSVGLGTRQREALRHRIEDRPFGRVVLTTWCNRASPEAFSR